MWWAIIGGVVVLVVVVVVLLLIYSGRKLKQWEQRIERDGDLVLCWIADAAAESPVNGAGINLILSTSFIHPQAHR